MHNSGQRQYIISTMPESRALFEYIHYYIWSMLEEEYGMDNCIKEAIPLAQVVRDLFIATAAMMTEHNELTLYNQTVAEIYALVKRKYPFISIWFVEQMCQEVFQCVPFKDLTNRVRTIFKRLITEHLITRFEVTTDHRKIIVNVRSERCV